MLEQRFSELLKGETLYSPVQNCAPFIHGSGIIARRFFNKYYTKDITSPYLGVIRGRECFAVVHDLFLRGPSVDIFGQYLRNQQILQDRVGLFADMVTKGNQLYSTYSYDQVKGLDWAGALPLVRQLWDLVWEGNAAEFFSMLFDKEMCKDGIKNAKFSISEAELDAIWDTATHPVKASFDKVHFMDVARARSSGANWREVAEVCQYIGTSYVDAKSLDEMEKLLAERYAEFVDAKTAQEKLDAMQKELAEAVEKYQTWRGGLNDNQKIIVDYLQAIIILRDQRKNFFFKGWTVIWRIAEHLFEEAGVDKSLIMYSTVYELMKGEDYLKEHAADYAKRADGFVILIDADENVQMETGDFDAVKKYIDDLYHGSHASTSGPVTELKGQIGCAGNVRGKVKIIMDISKAADFPAGGILVAGMTRPEYVPLMKKASAIITDEGGITCHAAIVSRELGIPCVIGTKNATKVLKDGDIVEVDATNGIIRKL